MLDDGKYAVMSLDMCGAIAMKRHFPTAIIYVAKAKEDLIKATVLSDINAAAYTNKLLSKNKKQERRDP